VVVPRVIPRAEHPISRRDIDREALNVLYRLHQAGFVAYLVGGSVRDLLLRRRPKDFDIGTSAHPHQVKRLFRNCWIIGRRFRLAHVRFGTRVVEVATFRRRLPDGERPTPPAEPDAPVGPPERGGNGGDRQPLETGPDGPVGSPDRSHDRLIHRDNTFGTPEEDAFRRDFTINGLFYDIASFSVIDYVGGIDDLEDGLIRCIGDPDERLPEDPVRMIRAIALAARLGFRIDPPLLDSIARHRTEIARSAPARLLEELYKILRAGASEPTFRSLAAVGLLDAIASELHHGAGEGLFRSLGALDAYRRRFDRIPETLTNAILIGRLLVPLGFDGRRSPRSSEAKDPGVRLGLLPLARRDVEHLRQVLALLPRLMDLGASRRAQFALALRGAFRDALTWLDIEGEAADVVAYWNDLGVRVQAARPDHARPRRRRRRRRRRPTASRAGEG
jgi:poly(A) polymerase